MKELEEDRSKTTVIVVRLVTTPYRKFALADGQFSAKTYFDYTGPKLGKMEGNITTYMNFDILSERQLAGFIKEAEELGHRVRITQENNPDFESDKFKAEQRITFF